MGRCRGKSHCGRRHASWRGWTILSIVERVGEEARDEMAEADQSVGDASRCAEDAAGGQSEVWGEMQLQVQEGQQHQACRAGGGDDRGDAKDRDELKREQLECVYPTVLLRRVLGFLTEE